MKRLLLLIGFVTGIGQAFAQQLPLYSQYIFNAYAINPAVGGHQEYYDVRSVNRYQWAGITDAPRTYTLSLHGPLKNRKMGLGGLLYTDHVGPTRRTGLQFSYTYHLQLNPTTKWAFGLSAGLLQFAIDGSKITLRDEDDYVLSNGFQSVLVPDIKFGMYFYSPEKYYVGISAPQLLHNKLYFFDEQTSSKSYLENHYYATAGYKFELRDDFQIEPSVLVKYVTPAPLQVDATARFIYKKQFWLGGSFRTDDAIAALVGFTYRENLMIGYSYDFTTTRLQNHSNGSHELMIGIKFINEDQLAKPQVK